MIFKTQALIKQLKLVGIEELDKFLRFQTLIHVIHFSAFDFVQIFIEDKS